MLLSFSALSESSNGIMCITIILPEYLKIVINDIIKDLEILVKKKKKESRTHKCIGIGDHEHQSPTNSNNSTVHDF